MAGDSLKSMYKMKLREENTISTRRMSRGLERKKSREDEVNKRRLLSDHMSPVLEDESFQPQNKDKAHKPVTQEKVSTRLQRLKQWREERQRTTQQQGKGGRKPVFKVSPLKHKGESHLYQSTATQQVKPGRQLQKTHEQQVSASLRASSRQQVSATLRASSRQQVNAQTWSHQSAGGSHVPADKKSAKYQPGNISSKDRQPAVVQLGRQTQRQPMNTSVSQSATRSRAAGKLPGTGSRADLASKLTVSAAAKAQANVDKPKAFLRANSRMTGGANSHVTRGAVQSQALDDKKSTNSLKQEKLGPCEPVENHMNVVEKLGPCEPVENHMDVVENHMDVVCSSEPDYSQSSSSDSKELHLSDSAVSTPKHSTPAPHRCVRRKTSSAYMDTHNVDDCKNSANSRDVSAMDVKRLDKPLSSGGAHMQPASLEQTLSQSHSVVHGQTGSWSVEINHNKGSKGHIDNGSQSPSTELVDTEVVSVLEVSNKENVACPQTELQPVSDRTPSRRLSNFSDRTPSRRLSNFSDRTSSRRRSNLLNEQMVVCLPVSGRQKSQRRSQRLASTASVHMSSASDQQAQARARPHDASSRLVLTDDSHTQLLDVASISPKSYCKPAKRRSVRIAGLTFSTPPDSHTAAQLLTTKYRKTPAAKRRPSTATHFTPDHDSRCTFVSVSHEETSHFSGDNIMDNVATSTTPRHKPVPQSTPTPTFEIIDRTQEDTALCCDNLGTVYKVWKPVEAQTSLRALQELAVHKYEGETSFIEVPLDDSTDAQVSVSTTGLLPVPVLSAADVMVVDISSTITDVDNQSTQPFTPRSNEMSTVVDSSTEISVTPRSSRRRGLSVSCFKTPAQAVSHSRTKPRHTPLKSPEEMIEILKKSPMIEFTRRRSRHLHLSGGQQLSASLHSLDVSMSTCEELTPCPLPSLATDGAKDGPQITRITQLDDASQTVTSGVQHFRELLIAERARLQQLCDTWTEVSSISPRLTEDVLGQIRSTIGKAQLLMDQRFQQFSGLVDNCQYGLGEKETTLTDLHGFWEMIDLQVQDVKQLFANLTQLQHNQWQVKQPSPARNLPQRKVVRMSKPKIKSNFAAFREEIIRRKAQAVVKSSMVAADQTLETTKVFDAGFFKVTSPVRKSGRKSQEHTMLKPVADSSSSIEEKLDHVASMSAEKSTDQTHSLADAGNKENQLSTSLGSRCLPLSAKRLSYLPAVPSPLLNDITGLLSKKF